MTGQDLVQCVHPAPAGGDSFVDDYRCRHGRDAHTGDRVVRIPTMLTNQAR